MKISSSYLTCEHCGKHIGKQFNHSKCSLILQEKYKNKKRKKRKKSLNEENIKHVALYIRKREGEHDSNN